MGREGTSEGTARTSDLDWRYLVRTVGEASASRALADIIERLALDAASRGAYWHATETARIAVEVRRGLAERAGTSLDPQLARALVGLAVHRFLSGRDSYMDALLEGSGVYRELANGAPEAFAARMQVLAHLVSTLDNSVRIDVERAAQRADGVEPSEIDREFAAYFLLKLRELQTLDEI